MPPIFNSQSTIVNPNDLQFSILR